MNASLANSVAGSYSVEEGDGHFWIREGNERVLLFVRMPAGGFICNALFLRQPGMPEPEMPESYHSATAMGVQLDFRWRWGGPWQPMERTEVAVSPREIRVSFCRRAELGRSAQKIVVSLRRDLEIGYVVHFQSSLSAETGDGGEIEFLNYLPADAGNSWPERKRFRASVHEKTPGRFERRAHSQLSVLERFFWSDGKSFRRPQVKEPAFSEVFDPALVELGSEAPFAVSHLHKAFARGGVLFFAGEKITPAVRVLSSSADPVLHTCDVWYDEHLCVAKGTAESDGMWRYDAEYEIFQLPARDERAALLTAVEAPQSALSIQNEFAPFFIGRPNTLNRPAAEEYDGSTGVFFAFENPQDLVSWQRNAGVGDHGAIVLNSEKPNEPTSGQHYQSVRYELGPRPWIETFPLGFALHIEKKQTLKFSAMVRTEGKVTAWVEVREAFWGKFHHENVGSTEQHIERTNAVQSSAWTNVEGSLTGQIPGSLSMIYLKMEGTGRAFFSDLTATCVAPN